MAADPLSIDVDLTTQSLLLASANHDIPALKDLLKTTSATVQDPETRFTPLHAAIAACEPDDEPQTNGNGSNAAEEERKKTLEAAAETVRLLLQSGAIWNDLDSNNETPGCTAKRLGLEEIYQLVVDAGVRAELLLSRLDQYQPLGDDDDEDDEDNEDDEEGQQEPEMNGTEEIPEHVTEPITTTEGATSNEDYLKDTVEFTDTTLLDSSKQGVMMNWETPIMKRHSELLLPSPNLRVLNIGHGMGIIDTFLSENSPSNHHIIEAHPAVLKNMRENGWYDKPNVVIHEGRWQDVLPKITSGAVVVFDAIYFDTFAEEYKALKEFFEEWVVQLLDSDGVFSFFNGMGADRQVCYDVYTKVVEMDLFEAGFDTEFEDIKIPNLQESAEWEGICRPYWALDTYKLPTCKFVG
ncbi:arginine N-methyltransferas-like protein [Tothia fuscella]|uniref:Arginine N-methyltransferase 2 n=1 Tax=Tothia fuscella TaxID=1048955 RepID=A0A9P4NL78_9PEZI|nr:arginine N-methyltransferas-like protein [Tothia fuscella]